MKDQVKLEFAVTNPEPKIHNTSDTVSSPNTPPNNGSAGSSSINSSEPNEDSIVTVTNSSHVINENNGTLAVVDGGDDRYFESFPPGYRFKPSDDELVIYYLKRKILNKVLPPNRIKEVELYKDSPEFFAAKYKPNGENEWFFFTPRDRKYPNGERPNRAAGEGYWKATGADKPINYHGVKIGCKKALVYYRGKPPRGDKTEWIMHEYRALDAPKIQKTKENMKLDDWVLCRLYRKLDRTVKGTAGARDGAAQLAPIVKCGDVNFAYPYQNSNGFGDVDESLYEDLSSAYVQQMIGFGDHMNLDSWMDTPLSPSSSKIPIHYGMHSTYYDHLNFPDLATTDFDQMFRTTPNEKDSK